MTTHSTVAAANAIQAWPLGIDELPGTAISGCTSA
jgi:hypothetical protein